MDSIKLKVALLAILVICAIGVILVPRSRNWFLGNRNRLLWFLVPGITLMIFGAVKTDLKTLWLGFLFLMWIYRLNQYVSQAPVVEAAEITTKESSLDLFQIPDDIEADATETKEVSQDVEVGHKTSLRNILFDGIIWRAVFLLVVAGWVIEYILSPLWKEGV
jgi:hypothetical protein